MDYEVIVVGYGPSGVTAANFLGQYGIKTLVLERDEDVYQRARAVTVDDFTLRLFQSVDLDTPLKSDMETDVSFSFRELRTNKEFFRREQTHSPYGQPPACLIYQPAMERTLRAGVERYSENVEVRMGFEATRVTQSNGLVQLTVADSAGTESSVSARYVLACDGGSSTMRKQIGIRLSGEKATQHWIVIDGKVKKWWPGRDSIKSWFDPDFPAIDIPLSMGHHRWEFPLRAGQTPENMAGEENWWPLLKRLGVTSDHVSIMGHAFYKHNELMAPQWRSGNVFLVGDAAHMTSPWAGQGMQSGIRDAQNLAWKLRAVLRHGQSAAILDTYQSEREPHVAAMTNLARSLGSMRMERNPVKNWIRRTGYQIADRLPVLGKNLREFTSKPPARIHTGFISGQVSSRSPIGMMPPQPVLMSATALPFKMDHVLGDGFAVVGMDTDPRDVLTPKQRYEWDALDTKYVVVRSAAKANPESGDEFIDHKDELSRWMNGFGVKVIALRPDRFVAATDSGGLEVPHLIPDQRQQTDQLTENTLVTATAVRSKK